ncbi:MULTISPECIES: serine hydrolase domain-containing protein [Bacillus cereus group]|uniref:serine hydrolase domain-containing protein n=1 Tax=Bacillus cereus group TaxID=86661 RepID=UPI0018F67609|nr:MULTISPECIES: serine hydrolase domain-containing protein [Bacillus cereus group]MBJ8008826.1 beta-lactamase family protein [Bacillus cereus]MDM5463290.1 serine hydrolase domain-containing protein [Bacillus cereus]QWH38307.1 beta-lactamase family protein [Bacillus mycoides]QWI50361.1 class A beta-lactamase-related serine hydrolase [Bacillus mycoides]WJE18401.1 serine hydrolase domain-containing protein [Bacillus cereus]
MKLFIIKKGTALTLTATILVGALAIPSYGNIHAVTKRTSTEQIVDKAADTKDIPGVIVTVKNGEASWAYASGEGNIERNHKVDADSAFRIGSTTKTFVTTVVLQLAGEKKLSLDDTVEKWLPGLINGNGYDGNKITIRQLLNHTSGIADYLTPDLKEKLIENPSENYTAEQLISRALQLEPVKGWSYSNTNMVIVGLIIQKVTGESYAEQIKKRIMEPLSLKETVLPGSSMDIPKKNARGYLNTGDKLVDITLFNPSFANASGEMISTGEDMTTFFRALLGGKLLTPEMQKEMVTNTVDTPLGKYGLGIHATKLPDGTEVWGHGGGIPGFTNFAGGTKDGQHVISININVLGAEKQINNILASEFAAKSKKDPVDKEKKSKHREEVKNVIDQVITNKKIPSVIAGGLKDGKNWSYATGTASYEVPHPVEPNFSFRIGSITKTFTASVVLQLAEEKQLNLDDSVEKWLPGVVQGNGYDGNKITIRQLLNHTSGIATNIDKDMRDFTLPQNPFRYYSTDELISLALAKPPVFAPGEGWDYSNTNTVIAGKIIQKVTGDTYAEQIRKRFIEPLGLKETFVMEVSSHIPGEHANGYNMDRSGRLYDLTEINQSWANAAGDMVSTAKDLTTFFSALLGGKLLNQELMDQMFKTVDSPIGKVGLGIYEEKTPDGQSYWGHAGGTYGFETRVGGPIGGEHILVTAINAVGPEVIEGRDKIFNKEFGR